MRLCIVAAAAEGAFVGIIEALGARAGEWNVSPGSAGGFGHIGASRLRGCRRVAVPAGACTLNCARRRRDRGKVRLRRVRVGRAAGGGLQWASVTATRPPRHWSRAPPCARLVLACVGAASTVDSARPTPARRRRCGSCRGVWMPTDDAKSEQSQFCTQTDSRGFGRRGLDPDGKGEK